MTYATEVNGTRASLLESPYKFSKVNEADLETGRILPAQEET